jgi:hypothetical protein
MAKTQGKADAPWVPSNLPRSPSGVLLNVPRGTTSRNPGPTSAKQSPFPVRPGGSISSAKGGGVAKRDRVDDVSDPDSPLYDPDDPEYDPDYGE